MHQLVKKGTIAVAAEVAGVEARKSALAAAVAEIRKQYGSDAVVSLDEKARQPVEVIRTGAIALDLALGVGGLPRGRMTEIFGPEGVGKTTLCYSLMAEAQRAGGSVAFIDTEHAADAAYAERCGVNLSSGDGLLVLQPSSGEQAFGLVEALVMSGGIDLVIVDSMATLVPEEELKGELVDSHIGAQARMIARGLTRLTRMVEKTRTALVFTNQTRVKIGGWAPHGQIPTTTPGGSAPKFWMGVRVELKMGSQVKTQERVLGHVVKATVLKNKVAAPYRRAEYAIAFPNGIDKVAGALDVGSQIGVLTRSGSNYSFQNERIANGREAAYAVLAGNPALTAAITEAIYAANDTFVVSDSVLPDAPEEL